MSWLESSKCDRSLRNGKLVVARQQRQRLGRKMDARRPDHRKELGKQSGLGSSETGVQLAANFKDSAC